MPPSQLKRLKASLRENGITGPQKSKKQKKEAAKSGHRIQRDALLHNIRESFNPFDVKAATRPSKMGVTTAKTMKNSGKSGVQILGRPAVTKSMGEETRRKTLLTEVQRRNKVGGILDRRIGENDPTLAPEERALQRFTREREREGKRGAGVFDLELDEGDEEEQLTHMGRTLELEKDDYDEGSLNGSSDEDDMVSAKRKRNVMEEDEDLVKDDKFEEGPERKKSKAEVMKEIMAKSKLYKYERQQAKEEDEEIREQLDKGVGDLRQSLFALQNALSKPKLSTTAAIQEATMSSGPSINPERAALMGATLDPHKDYDAQIRRMALDKRSKVTDASRTEEEKAAFDAERLKQLEDARLRRMRGEVDEEDAESEKENPNGVIDVSDQEESEADDAAAFGLKSTFVLERPPGFDDEDEFVVDEDLVASASESNEESDAESDASSEVDEERQHEDEEFLYGKPLKEDKPPSSRSGGLICPQTYEEVLELLDGSSPDEVHSTIRRVRQKYDAGLSSANKEKLIGFCDALVAYLSRRLNEPNAPSLLVFDKIIRHLHSLSRTYPDAIGKSFRLHLEQLHKDQNLTPSDLLFLTAIGTIYPTSDHFHQVVTPAVTIMARWLGLTIPKALKEFNMGAYLVTLCLHYLTSSKRYMPEAVNFTLAALKSDQSTPVLQSHITNLQTMVNLWSSKSAFIEIFDPSALHTFQNLNNTTKPHQTLQIFLKQSQLSRQPLQLHNHRPLPIKTAIPKFEESFNPDKHYDPNRERADAAKLQKEYKREKKGALRELRKDSNFLAREKLREKKERDRVYEEKQRRLIAEIQGEEGKEKNEYERERRLRKGRKKG
ncbi:Nop14-like protein [Tothia fuscella]|uniref:Nop14-like protein n=1 Tax=Tothia fuscella TaxID=1048955 RepID=A0A9P4U320_9PEZI|nr:Nop14-like protein [Tothia fuscella]